MIRLFIWVQFLQQSRANKWANTSSLKKSQMDDGSYQHGANHHHHGTIDGVPGAGCGRGVGGVLSLRLGSVHLLHLPHPAVVCARLPSTQSSTGKENKHLFLRSVEPPISVPHTRPSRKFGLHPFRTKTPNIFSQEETNLYCIIKLATEMSLFS